MIGEQIGNFKIVAQLGKGGMGEVYLGEHEKIGTQVAVKMLQPQVSENKELVERFFNEAIAVSKIQHAGTGKIFDVGFHASGRAYLVMEFLPGETLASRLRRLRKLPLAQVAEIGKQISSVLEAVHKAGITHRDLKPDNIFVVPDDELACGERVKIVDFGIAKLSGINGGITATSSGSMGTPAYMSPEQWKNTKHVDWRADAYSLGCVAFEMAAGRPPFIAGTIGEACSKHLTEDPPRLASVAAVPPPLDALIASLLAKSADDRPASMRDIANAFGAIAAAPQLNLATTQLSGQIAIGATLPAQTPGDVANAPTMATGVNVANAPTMATGVNANDVTAERVEDQPRETSSSPAPVSVSTFGGAPVSAEVAANKRPRALIFAAVGLAAVGVAVVLVFAFGGHGGNARQGDQEPRAGSGEARGLSDPDGIDRQPVGSGSAERANTGPRPNTTPPPASETPPLEAQPRAPLGFLTVRTPRAKATVFVDGVSVGPTPLENLPILQGSHKLEVVGPTGRRRPAEDIVIVAGQEKRFEFDKLGDGLKVGSVPDHLYMKDFETVFGKSRPAFDTCKQLNVSGFVKVHLRVGPDGRIVWARVQQAPNDAIGECAIGVVRRMQFPRTKSGGILTYSFPF